MAGFIVTMLTQLQAYVKKKEQDKQKEQQGKAQEKKQYVCTIIIRIRRQGRRLPFSCLLRCM